MMALSMGYNSLFRSLFLFTLAPSTASSRLMAFLVVQVRNTLVFRLRDREKHSSLKERAQV